jgi:adenine-specific DNA-methyltransferase
MRMQIAKWRLDNKINDNVYYFLLASLLESADKVANTTSVYGAYLKHLKKSAQKSLVLKPAVFELNDNEHQVFNEDSNQLIKRIEGDILYHQRQYVVICPILSLIVGRVKIQDIALNSLNQLIAVPVKYLMLQV